LPNLDYFVVDVFTGTALKGNQLAVVMNTIGLTSDQMQAIAREFNLSETTFIERREPDLEHSDGIRVRIFTTQEELDFAGHPTLGTASVLKLSAPSTLVDDTITLRLNVGPVPVKFSGDALFGQMTQPDPTFRETLDPVKVAELTGLDIADIDPAHSPQIVSTGTPFAIVMLCSVASLARLNVRQQEATNWLRERGARWFYVLAPTGSSQPDYRARMQFNGGEDPATGSAAGCAIAYLVKHEAVLPGQQIHLRQGVEIARPSDLFLAADRLSGRVFNVRVAGSTVLVAKGQLFLP
jgi:trans-2,3-dihydro-3-hydroxyanthranilate isomerase